MWYVIKDQHVTLSILAKPNAKTSSIIKADKQGLHVALHAKPKQGEANKELIAFLAKLLRIPKTQIVIQRGEGSRYKKVELPLTDTVSEFLNKWSNAKDPI